MRVTAPGSNCGRGGKNPRALTISGECRISACAEKRFDPGECHGHSGSGGKENVLIRRTSHFHEDTEGVKITAITTRLFQQVV